MSHRVEVPTSFLLGAKSEPFFEEIARRMTDAVPGATRTVLEGATHATYASAPAAFAGAVSSFVVRPE